MKKAILTTVIGLAMASGAAAETKSEFWFQPGAGKSTFDVGLKNEALTMKATGYESKETGMPLNLKYTSGLSEVSSWHIGSTFGTDQTETNGGTAVKSSGLGDIEGGYLANSDAWYYGGDVSLALGNKKGASATETGNRSTGGHALTPFVGYHAADMGVGVKVSYNYKLDRKEDSAGTPSTTETVTGGSAMTLNPYWETNYGAGIFGAHLGYQTAATSTTKDSAGATTSETPTITSMIIGAYVAHNFSADAAIVANLDMVTVNEFETTSGAKVKGSGTNIAAAYRMGF